MKNQEQIERGVIGSLIMFPNNYDIVKKNMDKAMFTDQFCLDIFKNISKRFEAGRSWDSQLLIADLPQYENSIYETSNDAPMTSEFIDYVKNLQLQSFVSKIKEATVDPMLTEVDELKKIVSDFDLATAEVKRRDFDEIIKDAVQEGVDAGVKDHEMPFVYRGLTMATKGAMRQNVHLVVGETGHSKTVFAWNLLQRPLEMGFKVNVYDYEMPDISMIQRAVSMMYRVPIDWLDKGRYHTGSRARISEADRTLGIQKIQEFGKKYQDNLIIRSNYSVDQMEKDIINTRPDIVLVDTIQAFCSSHPIKGSKTKADHITDLCQVLEGIAKKYNLAMFQTAQVNRANDSAIPKVSNIKESGGIAEKAGTIFCVRDKFKATKQESDNGVFDLEITKARHGQMGYFPFAMNPSIAYISEGLKTLSIEEERGSNKDLPRL